MSQTLYRFYDHYYNLLYVGITSSLGHRLGQHEASKSWWDQVRHVDVEHFDTRKEVEIAEIRAIKLERPAYNIAHAGSSISSVSDGAAEIKRIFREAIAVDGIDVPDSDLWESFAEWLIGEGFSPGFAYDTIREECSSWR